MKRKIAIVGALIAPLLLLSACSASSGALSEPAIAPEITNDSAVIDAGEAIKGAAGDYRSEITAEETSAVITTGSMSILTNELPETIEALQTTVTSNQGRIEQRSENPATEYNVGSATFTLRFPSDNLDKAIAELKTIGEVQSVSFNEQDVTLQYTDLKAQITALEAGVARLTELLAQADSTDALITIENAITDRQMQLDSLKSQELYLSNQIADATISVTLLTESEAEKTSPDNYFAGVIQGWDALVGFLGGILIFLGLVTPWLIPLGLIAFVVFFWLRRKKRLAPEHKAPEEQSPESSEQI